MSIKFVEDSWLGNLLGKPSFSLIGDLTELTASALERDNCFFQAKIDAAESSLVDHLTTLGFYKTALNISMELDLRECGEQLHFLSKDHVSGLSLQMVSDADGPAVQQIAQSAFSYDRFHSDPQIDERTADLIKEKWVANFFKKKRGDALFTAKIKGEIAGFILMLFQRNVAIIDLIAVKPEASGRGIGTALISYMQSQLPVEINRILVGTQATNQASLKLYSSFGFVATAKTISVHLHS